MTLEDLQTQFQVLAPDFPYSTYTATVLSWFNEAQEEVAKKRLISLKTTLTSTAETAEYVWPEGVIELKRKGLTYDGETLQKATPAELLDYYDTDWNELDSGTPLFYIDNGGSFDLVPKPDTTDKVIGINCWGYANNLSATTDIPFTTGEAGSYQYNPRLRSLDKLLLEYAVALAKLSLGFHQTRKDALATFFARLDRDAVDLKSTSKEDSEYRTKGIDPFHLRQKKTRVFQ